MSSMEVDIPSHTEHVNGFNKPSTTNEHNVQFDTEVKVVHISPTGSQQQQNRPKHKARRRARVPNLELENVEMLVAKPPSPSPSKLKKDRHSRTGRRGEPKKGGAGGKGTWGKLTDEIYADSTTRDTQDPNYSSDDDDNTYLVSPSSPQMSREEFEKAATEIFQEYFDNGDTSEVASSLSELSIKNARHEVVRLVISLALEEKAANREMVSILLSDLYGQVLNGREVAKGFELVLSQLDDLVLDTPDAPTVVGNFMARCVADDCLPPAFVSTYHTVDNKNIVEAVKRAQLLLSMKHSIARLDNVWGEGGGQRPVLFLISKINLLLKEYLSSGDCEEAVRCLYELEVPHFHHELIYEAVVMVLEYSTESCAHRMTTLLSHMARTGVVSSNQFTTGFMRVFADMTDIVLDIPNAYQTLGKFVERGVEARFVSPRLALEIPSRGRKRYISEGDGGAIKEPED